MAIGTGTALLGGAAIGGLAGMYGSKRAAQAGKKAANQSANMQQYMFDQSAAMQAPWQQTGASALAQLAGLYGLTPVNYMQQQAQPNQPGMAMMPGAENFMGMTPHDMTGAVTSGGGQYAGMAPNAAFSAPTQDAAMANFYTSPGYQFRMDEGMKALGGMASAQGLRGAGATSEDIMRYSQGLASDEYNQYTNRLAALAGLGQTSSGQMGNQALVTGRGIGDAYTQAGNARASGIMGVANTLGNTVNNAAWLYGMYGGGGAGAAGASPMAGYGISPAGFQNSLTGSWTDAAYPRGR